MALLATKPPLWAAENFLTSDTELSNEGYFVLNWDTDYDTVILQQSSSSAFSPILENTVPGSGAITITGLKDGEYYFRLNRNGIPVGNTLPITVQHHSMARAMLFFLLGLVLFLILLTTIVVGSKRQG